MPQYIEPASFRPSSSLTLYLVWIVCYKYPDNVLKQIAGHNSRPSEEVQPEGEDESDDSSSSDGSFSMSSDSDSDNVESGAQTNDNGDNEEEEDSVIASILRARDKPSDKPPEVDTEDYLVDISFHPGADLIAGASVTGDVIVYRYSVDATEAVATHEVHRKACRAIEYTAEGDQLITVSADKSIMVTDAETGKLRQFYDDAHEDPIYSLGVINNHLLATGDENGVLRLWDLRQKTHTWSSKKMDDYVSKILTNEAAKLLICVSGEGTVTAFDIAAKCMHMQSEVYDAELTCAGLFRKESKLVVGSARGSLITFNWGLFGLHSDELPWPKRVGIGCLVPVSDNIAVTGWENGQIRATYLFPHKQLGIIGHHQLSVEALDISHDGAYIASTSIDQKLRFWPISFLEDPALLPGGRQRNLPSSNLVDKAHFFADLA